MNSSNKIIVDDLNIVFVPLNVSDIKYLCNVFESWVALIGKSNEKVLYIYDLLKLMLASLDTVSSMASRRDHGTVSLH